MAESRMHTLKQRNGAKEKIKTTSSKGGFRKQVKDKCTMHTFSISSYLGSAFPLPCSDPGAVSYGISM